MLRSLVTCSVPLAPAGASGGTCGGGRGWLWVRAPGFGPKGLAGGAGCVFVPAAAMDRILARADPARRPHFAIGTAAITRH